MTPKTAKRIFLNKGIRCAHEALREILGNGNSRGIFSRIITERRGAEKKELYVKGRGIEDYKIGSANWGKKMEIDPLELAKAMLRRKSGIRILDVGAYDGTFLKEMKSNKEVGGKIKTTALVLHETEALKKRRESGLVDRTITASVESWLPRERYDIVFSNYGGMLYSPYPKIALRKIAYCLEKKGIAVILSMGLKSKELAAELAHDKGFRVKISKNAMIIKRMK